MIQLATGGLWPATHINVSELQKGNTRKHQRLLHETDMINQSTGVFITYLPSNFCVVNMNACRMNEELSSRGWLYLSPWILFISPSDT